MLKLSSKFKLKTKNLRRQVMSKAERRLRDAALMVEREAKKLVSKGNPDGDSPSMQWRPPKLRSGVLRSSIKTEKVTKGISTIAYMIGPTVIYGKFLEFGTKFMYARPFMRPALWKAQKNFKHLFKNLFRG